MDQQRFGPESAAVRRSSDGHCEARAHAREQKLRQDKEHTQSVDISEEFKQQIARLIELQEEAAESGYQGLEASVASIRGLIAQTPIRVPASTMIVRNPVIGELEKSVASLEVQKAGLMKEYTPESPEVQQIEAQLREARARIGQQVQSLIGEKSDTLNPVYQKLMEPYAVTEAQRVAVRAKIAGLKQAVANSKAELHELPSRALELAELTRTAGVLERTFTILNEKFQELRVSEAAQLANARVVDLALKPHSPIRPNKRINLALGLCFGLLLGMAVAFLQEHPAAEPCTG